MLRKIIYDEHFIHKKFSYIVYALFPMQLFLKITGHCFSAPIMKSTTGIEILVFVIGSNKI